MHSSRHAVLTAALGLASLTLGCSNSEETTPAPGGNEGGAGSEVPACPAPTSGPTVHSGDIEADEV
jgi:hypothetical protein